MRDIFAIEMKVHARKWMHGSFPCWNPINNMILLQDINSIPHFPIRWRAFHLPGQNDYTHTFCASKTICYCRSYTDEKEWSASGKIMKRVNSEKSLRRQVLSQLILFASSIDCIKREREENEEKKEYWKVFLVKILITPNDDNEKHKPMWLSLSLALSFIRSIVHSLLSVHTKRKPK